MSQQDWSTILKQQDDYVHEEDKRENERKIRIKSMYKNELQKMMADNKNNAAFEKEQDRRTIKWMTENEKRASILEEEMLFKKHQIKEQIAKENLAELEKRKERAYENNEKTKQFYISRYKKAMTEVKEESNCRQKYRIEEQQALAKAYDSKIQEEKNRKIIEKMEDEKFATLRYEIERKKDESRKDYLMKLKNGFYQNPEVYERSSDLIKERERERMNFIRKFVTQEKDISSYRLQEEESKARKIRETSEFNREYFQNRRERERNQSLNEINEYKNNYRTLQAREEEDRLSNFREADHKKRMLKIDLEKQMNEANYKRSRINSMSEYEVNINKGNYIPALPGVWRDHKSEKQQRIIEGFLKNEGSRGKSFWS